MSARVAEALLRRGYELLYVRRIMTALGLAIPAAAFLALTSVFEDWLTAAMYATIVDYKLPRIVARRPLFTD